MITHNVQVTKIFSKKILTKRALRELKCVRRLPERLLFASTRLNVLSFRLLSHFRGHKNVRSCQQLSER